MARFHPTLHPSQLRNLELSLEAKAQLAQRHGYVALDFSLAEAQAYDLGDPGRTKAMLERYGLVAGTVGGVLIANVFATEPEWDSALEHVTDRARRVAAYGGNTTGTVLFNRATRRRDEIWLRVAKRLWQVDRALDGTGIRLGIEFLGVRNLNVDRPYPFVQSMEEANQLLDEMGALNVGLTLDAYHWHAAGDSLDTVRKTPARRLVNVQLSDAKPRPRAQLIDNDRLLPGEGSVQLVPFLAALEDAGFDGLVAVEVLGPRLATADPDAAAEACMLALRTVFDAAGLHL